MRGHSQADSPLVIFGSPALPWWFRGDEVHLTAGVVDTWYDQSGHGLNGTAIVGQRPGYTAAGGPNGQPALIWSGAELITTAAYDPSSITLYNVYVLTPDLTQAGAGVLANTGTGVEVGTFTDVHAVGAPNEIYRGDHINTAGDNAWRSPSAVAVSPALVEIFHDKNQVSQQISIGINGVDQVMTMVLNNGGNDPFALFALTLGALPGLASPGKMTLAECFQSTVLPSAAQRQALLRGYLGPRYGIAVP